MTHVMPLPPVSADYHLQQIFAAKAAQRGAVIRRAATWVNKEIGRERFELEVRRRGFHLLETGGQYVVICNSGALRVVC